MFQPNSWIAELCVLSKNKSPNEQKTICKCFLKRLFKGLVSAMQNSRVDFVKLESILVTKGHTMRTTLRIALNLKSPFNSRVTGVSLGDPVEPVQDPICS